MKADSVNKPTVAWLLAGACMGRAVPSVMEPFSHAQAQAPVPPDRRRQLSPERAVRMEAWK
jgi:hypothetical protein